MVEVKEKTFPIPPSPNIIGTLSHSGYKIDTSIADLLDNSIAHNAHNIDIKFNFNDTNINNWTVEIIDDGDGMDSQTLSNAFIMGDRSLKDVRDNMDHGRYSVGMKTASIAQADYLLVVSKMRGKEFTAKAMDMDYLSETKEWNGYDFDGDSRYENVILNHGTNVIWKKLKFIDKTLPYELAKKDLYTKIDKVCNYLGMVFHRFIEKGSLIIKVQGREIKSWDPFFKSNLKTRVVDSFEDEWIKTKTYILPSKDEVNEDEFNMMNKGDALGHQGFYVYRNNRMILAGGWLNLKNCKIHQKLNALRISIDFDSKLDEYFDVGFTKSTIEFPKNITDKLENIVKIGKQKASENLKQKARIHIKPGTTSKSEIWVTKNTNNKMICNINLEHPLVKEYTKGMDPKNINKLFKLISGSIPTVYASSEYLQNSYYTDEEMMEYIDNFYKNEQLIRINEYAINRKKFNVEVFEKMVNIEPFCDYLDLVQTYFDNEVVVDE